MYTTMTLCPWQREGWVPLHSVGFWNGISHHLQEYPNPVHRRRRRTGSVPFAGDVLSGQKNEIFIEPEREGRWDSDI